MVNLYKTWKLKIHLSSYNKNNKYFKMNIQAMYKTAFNSFPWDKQ